MYIFIQGVRQFTAYFSFGVTALGVASLGGTRRAGNETFSAGRGELDSLASARVLLVFLPASVLLIRGVSERAYPNIANKTIRVSCERAKYVPVFHGHQDVDETMEETRKEK